jgi:pimeloyl-ACP methyl ester carboxylesterase
MTRALVGAVILGLAATAGHARQAAAPASAPSALRVEPFTLKAYDGRERPAERIRLTVPADGRDARTFEIVAVRLRPTGAATRPPIVFLMGGPGVPATVIAPIPPYFTLFTRLAEGGDVILLDQRGLGESTPKSDCPPGKAPLPANVLERPEALVAAFAAAYRACAAALPAPARATDFTIDHVADDVEAIRRALGVPQVDLLGFSFGSRIALEVLKRHPDRVRKLVLQGVLGVDTLRQPSLDDAVFRRFAGYADAQATVKRLPPSVAASVKTLQERAASGTLRLPIQSIGGDSREIRLGPGVLNAIVLAHLGDPALPGALADAVAEQYGVLTRWAQGLLQDLEKGGGSLMARAMVCSVASPLAAQQQAARDAPSTLLGEAIDNQMQQPAFCEMFGVRPPAEQPAVVSRVPALLISGSDDPRTPPDRAEVTRKGLAGSEHVIVQNGGHELLPDRAVQDLVLAFLDGKPDRVAITQPAHEVLTIEDARKPPRRPGGR